MVLWVWGMGGVWGSVGFGVEQGGKRFMIWGWFTIVLFEGGREDWPKTDIKSGCPSPFQM